MVWLIAVCGSDDCATLQESMLSTAEEIGRLIAQQGGIVVCGGRGGVMRAVCKGAKKAGGLTIGILPDRKDEANEWVDVPLATGLGVRRNMVIVHAADVVIALNGRWGTLNEISFAQIFKKPLVLVRGSGGCVDDVIGGKTLASCGCRYSVAGSAQEAVEQAFSWCEQSV